MYIFKWWIFSIVMLVLGFFNILSFHYVTCPRWLKSLLQGTNRDPDPPVVVQLKAHHLRCGKWASQIWLDTSSSVISHQSSDFSHQSSWCHLSHLHQRLWIKSHGITCVCDFGHGNWMDIELLIKKTCEIPSIQWIQIDPLAAGYARAP